MVQKVLLELQIVSSLSLNDRPLQKPALGIAHTWKGHPGFGAGLSISALFEMVNQYQYKFLPDEHMGLSVAYDTFTEQTSLVGLNTRGDVAKSVSVNVRAFSLVIRGGKPETATRKV